MGTVAGAQLAGVVLCPGKRVHKIEARRGAFACSLDKFTNYLNGKLSSCSLHQSAESNKCKQKLPDSVLLGLHLWREIYSTVYRY